MKLKNYRVILKGCKVQPHEPLLYLHFISSAVENTKEGRGEWNSFESPHTCPVNKQLS